MFLYVLPLLLLPPSCEVLQKQMLPGEDDFCNSVHITNPNVAVNSTAIEM